MTIARVGACQYLLQETFNNSLHWRISATPSFRSEIIALLQRLTTDGKALFYELLCNTLHDSDYWHQHCSISTGLSSIMPFWLDKSMAWALSRLFIIAKFIY
jgi:hypothetical protein